MTTADTTMVLRARTDQIVDVDVDVYASVLVRTGPDRRYGGLIDSKLIVFKFFNSSHHRWEWNTADTVQWTCQSSLDAVVWS
mmetsp:Transcript_2916/g.3289  ORF Transcript_2916/g.3289 Transcript_2916/m.3289 type:complete len:82 (+) Transcript_2916:110-355(+)